MDRPVSSERFYADLPSFTHFEEFADFGAYQPVPEDWVVVLGDIVSSTRAISEGRYKAVNMVGAAVITSVLNACRGTEVPYVFGGDGGALVVPGHVAERAADALRCLQCHSSQAFGLDLRAAAIPVTRLRDEGYDVRLRRFQLNSANHLAVFSGGGIEHADTILKAGGGDPAILSPDQTLQPPDLTGLSCRWEPLSAVRGRMIALMLQPVGNPDPTRAYRSAIDQIAAALEGGLPAHAPASDQSLVFRWPPRGLPLEVSSAMPRKLADRLGTWCNTLFTSLMQKWCHWRGAQIGPYNGPRYQDEVKAQTDFRKFDGCLRVVLDCSESEVDEIERWLESEFKAGRLVYGLHVDNQALMTCLVFSLEESQHVHFIDAAGGGFAKAAEGFKQRLASIRGGTSLTQPGPITN